MRYCPLMSYGKQYCTEVSCFEEECAFAADGAGECLVKQALQLYVAKERTRIAEEEEIYTPPPTIIIDDTPQIDGYNTPVAGGITYAHVTPTEKYPHGGWFEVPGFHGEPE